MIDVEKIKDETSGNSLSDKFKEKAKGAAGTVKEKAKEGAGKAKEKAKEKAKKKYYDWQEKRKEKKAQKKREKEAYEEARREGRVQEAKRRGRYQGKKAARDLAAAGYSGSKTGRVLKNFATRMSTMMEDTGGAFGTENRKPGFTGMNVKLRSSGKQNLDLSPKMNMLSSTDKKRDLFGSSRSPEDFFGKSNKNMLGKKKKKDIKFF